MSLDDNLRQNITGIRPFDELPIDAKIWREAHAQHHAHRRLHAVAAHRPGIVYGLEVVASRHDTQTIVVAPGVGTDSLGQTIVVRDPTVLRIKEGRQIYVTLTFKQERDSNSRIAVSSGEDYYRVIEGRDLSTASELPAKPHLELARIFRTDTEATIKNAVNPFAPGNDEINLLFRPVAFPYCYADAGVGELSYVPTTGRDWSPNRAGLWNLLREGNGRGFRLLFTGPPELSEATPSPTIVEPVLLYVAGKAGMKPLKDAPLEGLRRFLDKGGLLMGEACQGGAEFETDFKALAARLGAHLEDKDSKVGKGHPLLSSQYVFAAPPAGTNSEGTLLADLNEGVLFSTHDYGGAWQGDVDKPDAPDSRERIRQSVEFGLNIVAFAAQRRRMRELEKL